VVFSPESSAGRSQRSSDKLLRAAARLRPETQRQAKHKMTKWRDTRPGLVAGDEFALACEPERLDREAGLFPDFAHHRFLQGLTRLDHAARQREHACACALARRAISTRPSRMIAALTARNGRSGYIRGSFMWISVEQRVDRGLLLARGHVFRGSRCRSR
jgi:hypothetical protein